MTIKTLPYDIKWSLTDLDIYLVIPGVFSLYNFLVLCMLLARHDLADKCL